MRNGHKQQRFEPYQGRLFGFALAISGDREAASDLVHDCIVRAMTARNVPADEAAYRAWLFTIVRNLWRDHVRASSRGGQPVELDNVGGNRLQPAADGAGGRQRGGGAPGV